MLRKALIAATAVVLPLGIGSFVMATSPASASTPPVTANGSATCTAIAGVIKFNPPLFNTATSTSETATFKIKLNSLSNGCSTTATNLPTGGILYGIASGTLTSTTNACASLGTSQPVALTVKWFDKNSSGTTLAKLTPTSLSFSGFDVLLNGSNEPGFDLPQDSGGTTNATGSFAGTSSDANAFTAKDVNYITSKCGSSTGLTSLKLGGPGTTADPSQAVVH